MKLIFGADIGGTEIKFGAFSETCSLLDKWSVQTDLSEAGRHIIPTVAREVKAYTEAKGYCQEDILGIGLGIPGPVDKNGYVETCVNLNWHKFSPVEELQRHFPKTRAAAGNDANVAALGEYYHGAGKGYSSMMMITLGTGVGGGIILNGKILLGAHGLAGEIGHITPEQFRETETCNCGNTGCIDQFASATGIVRIMKRLMEGGSPCVLQKQTGFSAKDVCDAAKQGDSLALQCIDICMGALGKGMAFFSHAFDPEVFVIGGGVSRAGALIIDSVKKEYEKNLFLIGRGADIRTASLGNDAGITGACMLIAGGGDSCENYL